MSLKKFLNHALSEWMSGGGPDSDVVISSRLRLARNLHSIPFPMLSTNEQSQDVMAKMYNVTNSDAFKETGSYTFIRLSDLQELEKRVLVEKHLISPNLAE